MNHYFTSSGESISKAEIDRKVKAAKKKVIESQLEEFGYNFCEDCGKTSGWLDCSHTISVDKCQKERRSELAWDTENIKIRCRKCHQKLDGLDLKFMKNNPY